MGARCPDCASPLRPVAPSRLEYLVAGLAGLGVGIAGGALLALVPLAGLGGIALLLLGFGVGEVVSLSARRRGGKALALVAFVGAFAGPLLGRAVLFGALTPIPDPGLRAVLAATAAIQTLGSIEVLFLILAGVVASTRAH